MLKIITFIILKYNVMTVEGKNIAYTVHIDQVYRAVEIIYFTGFHSILKY